MGAGLWLMLPAVLQVALLGLAIFWPIAYDGWFGWTVVIARMIGWLLFGWVVWMAAAIVLYCRYVP